MTNSKVRHAPPRPGRRLAVQASVLILSLCGQTGSDPGVAGADSLRVEERDIAALRLDAIAAPTNGPAWVIDLVNGDNFSVSSSTLAAVSGYANVTVPMGYVRGLPVGLSVFGTAFSEPVLLRITYAFEQAAKARRRPEFLPTLVLE